MAQRAASGLIAAAVAAVAVVAVVDAVRGRDSEEPEQKEPALTRPPAAGVESRIAIANRLRQEGIRGRLLYTDESCGLRSIALPDLEPAPTPGVRGLGCGFSASPDGTRVATPGAAWSPDSRRVAVCRGSAVVVSVATERAPEIERHEGCRPAWRPDGVLTLVRDGEVVNAGGRRVVTATAIEAAVRRNPVAPDASDTPIDYEVVDLAWLTSRRVALLLEIGFLAGTHVVFFEDARDVGRQGGVAEDGTRLDASRDGGFVAVRPGVLLDAEGRRLYPLPGLGTRGADAVAVSPDGLWVAVGLRGRVTLLSIPALRAGRIRSVTLPFAARDVAWR